MVLSKFGSWILSKSETLLTKSSTEKKKKKKINSEEEEDVCPLHQVTVIQLLYFKWTTFLPKDTAAAEGKDVVLYKKVL